jgi:hypothetical protein
MADSIIFDFHDSIGLELHPLHLLNEVGGVLGGVLIVELQGLLHWISAPQGQVQIQLAELQSLACVSLAVDVVVEGVQVEADVLPLAEEGSSGLLLLLVVVDADGAELVEGIIGLILLDALHGGVEEVAPLEFVDAA